MTNEYSLIKGAEIKNRPIKRDKGTEDRIRKRTRKRRKNRNIKANRRRGKKVGR
jgi:hypothetical protein